MSNSYPKYYTKQGSTLTEYANLTLITDSIPINLPKDYTVCVQLKEGADVQQLTDFQWEYLQEGMDSVTGKHRDHTFVFNEMLLLTTFATATMEEKRWAFEEAVEGVFDPCGEEESGLLHEICFFECLRRYLDISGHSDGVCQLQHLSS
jgi:hypothetical protein